MSSRGRLRHEIEKLIDELKERRRVGALFSNIAYYAQQRMDLPADFKSALADASSDQESIRRNTYRDDIRATTCKK